MTDKSSVVYPTQEPFLNEHRHLLCWKSAFAGLLISLMAFTILIALGAGIGGFTAEALVKHEESGSGLATGAGLYLGLSVVASLFCGGYFALRISQFVTARVGAAHGFVIASAFFLLMLTGFGNLVGGLASSFGSLAKSATTQVSDLAASSGVQDTINQALGSAHLKSPTPDVVRGLTNRLFEGNMESAKKYLAYETGMSQPEVDAKLAEAKIQFDAAVRNLAQKSARTVGDTGFVLFVTFLVGLIAAVIGGRFGAHSNVDRPFAISPTTSTVFSPLAGQHGSIVPYVFGWLLGVPISILFLIAMLRTVF